MRELDARHKNELSDCQKENAREKNVIIASRHKEVLDSALETIEEEEEEPKDESLQAEINTQFNKLEEERKKNTLLEETIRNMRKKYKDEIELIKTENQDMKSTIHSLEKE